MINYFLKAVVLILILVVIPLCNGMITTFYIDRRKRKPGMIYVAGFVTSLAIFQIISVPVTILKADGFPIIVTAYTACSILFALIGIALAVLDVRTYGKPLKNEKNPAFRMSREEKIEWAIVIILIGLQLFMYFFMASFDGDDAYYVVQSLLTDQTDTLYRIKPYTGLATDMDIRHGLAGIPIWEAYVARMSGIHSTIIAHSVIGFILIPVVYIIYYECACLLLKKDNKRKIPIFMIFICLMNIFGNVSIYTNATFFLTRTWQGKSMLANMIIALVVWLFLAIFETDKLVREWRIGYWALLFATCIVASMCSTASVFLVAILIGVMGLVLTIKEKNLQIALRLLVTCVPLIVFAALYLLV